MYKKSCYNFFLDTSDGFYLLYNSRTGAFAAVPSKLKSDVDHLIQRPIDDNNLSIKNELINGGFIVPSDFDELSDVKSRFLMAKSDKSRFELTLLASEACNFKCPYCFVYERRGFNMKQWVYDAILKLIKANTSSETELKINWYGGEPTLAHSDIIRFMERLNLLKNNKRFASLRYSMVTNGYLLTRDKFEQYINRGLNFFQITLDGDKTTHDKTRCLASGEGSYDVIWDNLLSLRDVDSKYRISIRVNFLAGMDAVVNSLTERFNSVFRGDDRFSIYFRPVYNFNTSRDDISSIKNDICSIEDGINKQLDYGFNSAIKSGRLNTDFVANPVPTPVMTWCNAERDYFWTVGADGLLFKCDSLIGDDDKACGCLHNDGTIELFELASSWDQSIYDENKEKCIKCNLLPICQGGCPRVRKSFSDHCYYRNDVIRTTMLKTHNYYKERRNV